MKVTNDVYYHNAFMLYGIGISIEQWHETSTLLLNRAQSNGWLNFPCHSNYDEGQYE